MEFAAKKAVELLNRKKLKIAVAESCTGGLIAKLITDVSGASAVFECGVVSYSNSVKASLLNVSESTLKTYGAVSEQTVCEMVHGIQKLSGADITVSVSGIAGPSSDATDKPVGLIWIAVLYKDKITTLKLNNLFTDNIRENNRNTAAKEALETVCKLLSE